MDKLGGPDIEMLLLTSAGTGWAIPGGPGGRANPDDKLSLYFQQKLYQVGWKKSKSNSKIQHNLNINLISVQVNLLCDAKWERRKKSNCKGETRDRARQEE